MTERLYLDRPDVYMLADCDDRDGGRAQLVVCEHPDGAEYAARLAASLGLPLHYRPGELTGPGARPPGRSGPTVAALAPPRPATGRRPGRHAVSRRAGRHAVSRRPAGPRTAASGRRAVSQRCGTVSRRSGGRGSRGAGRPAAASRPRSAG